MVQRRVVHRYYYLRPSPQTDDIFRYCLARAVLCTGVRLHEFMVMSNHYHVVLSDPKCALPKFEQILNAFSARAINRYHGLVGTFWERESFTAPELDSDASIIDRCVYALTNPCSANLVEFPEDWTGISSWSLEYGQTLVARRPAFFSDRMPAELEIRLVRPPVMLDLDDAQLRQEIRRRARERALELIGERRESGTTVLGMRRVADQSIHGSPQPRHRAAHNERRETSRSRWSLTSVAQRSPEWIRQYKEALHAWIEDHTKGVFPCGTYLMRVRYGAACASP
jgi:REP element-mobilizing transposase RayT